MLHATSTVRYACKHINILTILRTRASFLSSSIPLSLLFANVAHLFDIYYSADPLRTMIPNIVQSLVVFSSALVTVVWALPLLNNLDLLGLNVLETDPQEVLAVHNHFREIHGSPPLTWDNSLATYALQWSKECILKHSGVSLASFHIIK